MLELDGIAGLLLLGLWLYCVFDVIAADATAVRNLPKPLWLTVVFFVPDLGSIAWLLLGRPSRASWRPGDGAPRRERASGPRGEHPAGYQQSIAERDRLIAEWRAEDAARRPGGGGGGAAAAAAGGVAGDAAPDGPPDPAEPPRDAPSDPR